TLGLGFAVAAGDAAVGKAIYEKSCKACHGASGAANPNIAKMMKVEIPDLSSGEVQGLKDADLKQIITEGKGKMKPVKTVVGNDVDNVIAYVRTLKKSKDLLDELSACGHPPRMIVTSEIADERLWTEVLNVGGFDVLLKPLDPKELFRVVSLARRSWCDNGRRPSDCGRT